MYHNKVIHIRIPEETHRQLTEVAKQQGDTISALLRKCIKALVAIK